MPTTTIRLPEDLKARVAAAAKRSGTTAHGFILEALTEKTKQEHNPQIGHPANNDKRELVIGRRSHGYVALYRYVAEVDTVFVLAVRSQREVGFVGV